jgi:hypothetical protein
MGFNGRMFVNNELVRMWNEVGVTCFKVLSLHLPVGAEGNNEKPEDS